LLDSLLQETNSYYMMTNLNLVLTCLALFCVTEGAYRGKRADCGKVHESFNTCTKKAYRTYTSAIAKGDDGRDHWKARKSCNYMTDAIEDCGNLLVGECMSQEAVNKMKDDQLAKILVNLQTTVEDWDSDKCPPIQKHIERMRADMTTPAPVTVEETPEPEVTSEPEPEPTTASASSLTIISSVLILVFSFLL